MNAPLNDRNLRHTPDSRQISMCHRHLILLRAQEDRHLVYRGEASRTVLHYFERCIAARPTYLRNHIRRTYLAIGCADAELLWGALVDLALVLRGRGRQLLMRLLDQATPLLQVSQLQLYRQACVTGDMERLSALPIGRSVLSSCLLPNKAVS